MNSTPEISLDVRNEIKFMLYNYNNIEDVIKNYEIDLIETMHIGLISWIKGERNNNNAYEDEMIKIIENKRLKRLKKWKEVIEQFFKEYKRNNDNINYSYIELRYFQKQSIREIEDKLKLNEKKQSAINKNMIALIFYYAVDAGLYEKEEAWKESK